MMQNRMGKGLGIPFLTIALLLLVSNVWGGEEDGFMTGGGGIFTTTVDTDPDGSVDIPAGARIEHAFQLHCAPTDDQGSPMINPPNNLQINIYLANGDNHRFHLERLTFAQCLSDIQSGHPAAPFYWYNGAGEGRYDGVSGYCATWIFTDEGEPETNDRIVSLRIGLPNSSGECGFSEVSVGNEGDAGGRKLYFGNHQTRGTAGKPHM